MKLDRAYSLIEIKSIDDDQRIIEGIATTPTPDRIGDIVVSEGAEFKLPLPLLMQHNAKEPIGHVLEAKVTKKGISIKAKFASIDEEGTLKARLTEAWHMVKSGLVQGLSIGFKSIEHEPIIDEKNKDNPFAMMFGPRRHKKWLWLELSAVTIPANGEATITAIKAIDTQQLAAIGQKVSEPVRLLPPGASGKSQPNLKAKEADDMKTIAEQITALEATRAAKMAAMEAVMQKSMEEGRSTDEKEQEEFDTLQLEVEKLDGDLKRLKALEKFQMQKATPAGGVKDAQTASDARGGVDVNGPIHVRERKLPPGIRMARVVKCLGMAQGIRFHAAQIAEEIYKDDPVIAQVLKATVPAGTTISGNWAEGLVGTETSVFADFVEYLRPQTILGKFGNNGIPGLRMVPFRTALVGQTGGGAGYWVGEGKAKPLTSFDFSRTTLTPLKVANIAVLTEELVRDSSPSAEMIIRDSLVAALRERLDLDFINPDKAAVSGVSPASILNGITPVASIGTDADSIRRDIRELFGTFIAANNPPTNGVWIMSARTALALSLMQNPLGQTEFVGIGMNGGTFNSMPVIVSEYLTPNTSGDFVALVNASDIYVGDEGGFAVDMSREASLEMSDAPASTSATPTGASLVSMFQTNSVAFRAERTINWARRRNEGVAWLSNVAWGQTIT